MRTAIVIAAGLCVSLPGAAFAQQAKNSPEGIVCAITGSCGAPAADAAARVPVGDEKAFSLARSSPATVQPAKTDAARLAPTTSPRAAMSAHAPQRSFSLARVQPDGGLDMLVNFKLGSAELTPGARAEARAFARAMAAPQMAGLRFAIEGHTDASGQRDRNVALSDARARSVVDYLVSQGVDSNRLTAKGYGPDRPIPGTSARSPANRRVEFVKVP